jgi:MinD-like ATPase involved in chromosome partitioning or flagellar assembly/CheY-like chemotaxis protein
LQVIRVLQIEDNRIEARQTQHWLANAGEGVFSVECVDQLALGMERLTRGEIDIVLLDLNLPDSRGEATFEKLYGAFPDVPVVVLTGEYDDAIGPSTVAKGAQDYLVKQRANSDSLVHVLRYALARHHAQQDKIKNLQLSKSGRVFAFIGAKGGVGTTTTALNVAVALAMQGKSVILAELRPCVGTVAFHLPQLPARGLRTLLDLPPDRVGQYELNSVLYKGPAGLWILLGPKEDEEEFRDVDPLRAEAIIRGLSQLAEYVILDLPPEPTRSTQAAINLCHFAAVVTEREPVSVQAGKVIARKLTAWGARGNLAGGVVRIGVIVVIRTIYPNYAMAFNDIQEQMGCEILGISPWGATENLKAANERVPLVLLQPDNDTALSYVEIANRLTATIVAQ